MGLRIRQVRENLGMSQTGFSKSIGISQTDLSAYENARRAFPHKHILTLQSVFNVNPVWLQEGEGEMFIGGAAPAREANEGQKILFTKVGERLSTLRAALKLTAAELAQVVGATEADVAAAEKGEKKLTGAQTAKLKNAYPTVNGQWLEHGSGAMLLETEAPKQKIEPLITAERIPGAEKHIKFKLLPIYEVNVEAGDRAYHDDVAQLRAWEAFPFYGDMEADCVFTVRGDSMEPRFLSGDRLVCKELTDWRFIGNNTREAFVVHFANMCWVKFINQNRSEQPDGYMELMSLNPAYSPLIIPAKEIRHVWKIVSIML